MLEERSSKVDEFDLLRRLDNGVPDPEPKPMIFQQQNALTLFGPTAKYI